MIESAGAPIDKGLTDLSVLGVPLETQHHFPTAHAYPRKFARDAFPVWKELVESPDFKVKALGLGTRDMVWHVLIQDFLSKCADVGVYPFYSNTETPQNEYLQDFVRRSRIEIVQFCQRPQVELFKRVQPKYVYREYVRTQTGLIVQSWADLWPVKDPTFRDWLVQSPWPRFLRSMDCKFTKRLRPNVNMWVRYISPGRVTFGYSITCTGTVNIPGNKTPTQAEVDEFIDRQIFYPIVRAHRFVDVRSRLF